VRLSSARPSACRRIGAHEEPTLQNNATTLDREAAATVHTLPPLPYEAAALEPHIDARTMTLHHDKHHASYVEKLNTALQGYPELQGKSAVWLMINFGKLPDAIRETLRDNAGGHVNHSLFWKTMSPRGGGAPSGSLADAIDRDFGSLNRFKAQFDAAGAALFGSGWVWLVRSNDESNRLSIATTTGHGNPLTQGCFPVLVNDVWEHAYYLKHENRRADYLRGWWSVVNWQEAARRYAGGFETP